MVRHVFMIVYNYKYSIFKLSHILRPVERYKKTILIWIQNVFHSDGILFSAIFFSNFALCQNYTIPPTVNTKDGSLSGPKPLLLLALTHTQNWVPGALSTEIL